MARTANVPLAAGFIVGDLGSYVVPLLVGGMGALYGLSVGQLGLIVSAQAGAAALSAAALAPLMARIDRRVLAVAGACLVATANLLAAAGVSVVALIASRLLAGVGEGGAQAAATAQAADSDDPNHTFALMWVAIVAMAILVFLTLPALAQAHGPRAVFLLLAGLVLAMAAMLTRLPRRVSTPASAGETRPEDHRIDLVAGVLIGAALCLFAIAANCIWYCVEGIGTRLGMTPDAVGRALSIAAAAALIGPLAATALKGAGRIGVVIAAMLLGGVSVWVLTRTTDAMVFTATLAVSSAALMFVAPRLLATAAAVDVGGRLTTGVRAASSAGSVLAPAIAGALLLSGAPYEALGWLALLCAVVASLLLAALALRTRRGGRLAASVPAPVDRLDG